MQQRKRKVFFFFFRFFLGGGEGGCKRTHSEFMLTSSRTCLSVL